jgi:hypothetical protein
LLRYQFPFVERLPYATDEGFSDPCRRVHRRDLLAKGRPPDVCLPSTKNITNYFMIPFGDTPNLIELEIF